MPDIFSKDTKLKVIEYGGQPTQRMSFKDMREALIKRIKKVFRP